MRWLAPLLLSALLCFVARAQEDATDAQEPLVRPPVVPELRAPIKAPIVNIVREGTAVPVRLRSALKAKEAQVGDLVDLALDHDLWVGTLLVARAGTAVEAIVVDAAKAKWASCWVTKTTTKSSGPRPSFATEHPASASRSSAFTSAGMPTSITRKPCLIPNFLGSGVPE
jgi:hypothetical protein